MLVMPEKYYRVCCNCGKIMRVRQLIDVEKKGKREKCCPYCGTPENSGIENVVISEYQARCLFMVANMASQEFYMDKETMKKYDSYYDAYNIPKKYRVY